MGLISKNKIPLLGLIFLIMSCASDGPPTMTTEERRAEIFYTYGTQALVDKNYTEALDNLLKAYDINPKDSKLNNNLGMAYFFKGRSDKAIEFLQKAIELDKKNSDAKNNLASVYFNLGQLEESKKLYLEVMDDLVYQHQYRVLHSLALIAIKEKNYSLAEDYLKRAIEQNIDYCAAHYTLGKLELARGRNQEAVKHLRDANKGQCFSEEAPLVTLAQTYYEMGDFEHARIKCLEYIERFPTGSFAKQANKIVSEITDRNDSRPNTDKVEQSQSAPKRSGVKTNSQSENQEFSSDPNF